MITVGVALRLTMLRFDVHKGYDFDWHALYIQWFVAHPWQLPLKTLSPEVYHPPLYHWLAGQLVRAGLPIERLNYLSVLLGIVTLVVFQLGLVRFVQDRTTRLAALALAAILPATLQLDGMATNEALNTLLTLIVLLLAAHQLTAARSSSIVTVALGLVLGLALLTKISSLVVFAALILAAFIDYLVKRDRQRALSWLSAFAVTLIISGWYFAANIARYHKPILDAAECGQRWYADDVADFRAHPYLARRPLSFYGWTNEIMAAPYGPTAFGNEPRLLPALIASTFVDSYNYGFTREAAEGEPFVRVARMKLRPAHLWLSQASATGGVLIAWTTIIAWLILCCRRRSWRDPLVVLMLAIPLLALAGQAHYAHLFPPRTGPVKGVYMQLAAPLLCILWGAALSSLRRHSRAGRLLFAIEIAALLPIAAYVLYCRIYT